MSQTLSGCPVKLSVLLFSSRPSTSVLTLQMNSFSLCAGPVHSPGPPPSFAPGGFSQIPCIPVASPGRPGNPAFLWYPLDPFAHSTSPLFLITIIFPLICNPMLKHNFHIANTMTCGSIFTGTVSVKLL